MALFPSGRTSPTIKPLATSQSLDGRRGWEIKLGAVHAAVLMGIVTGSMVCAFYLGLASGQRAGFESAQAALLANTAKLPIPDEFRDGDSLKRNASEIYAKLSDTLNMHDSEGGSKDGGTLPEVGSIKSLDDSPIIAGEGKSAEDAENIGGTTLNQILDESSDLPMADVGQQLPALGRSNSQVAKTIGSLNARNVESAAKEVDRNAAAAKAKQIDPPDAPLVVAKLNPPERTAAEKKVDESSATQTDIAPNNSKSLIREVLPKGWYAQVAAPKQGRDAEHLAAKLNSGGFPVLIEKASVRGEQYFRVLVGPEENRQRAQILVQQLKGESFIRGEPFLRLVR